MLYENGEFERIRPHLTPLECGIIFDGIPEGAISRKVGLIWGIPDEDGSPVLCITDGVPIGATENSQFDVTSSLKSVSKWYGYLDKPERLPEFMRRAFTMLRTGRPGPVVLAIPDAGGLFDENADPYIPVKGWKSAPNPDDVSTAVELLLRNYLKSPFPLDGGRLGSG